MIRIDIVICCGHNIQYRIRCRSVRSKSILSGNENGVLIKKLRKSMKY